MAVRPRVAVTGRDSDAVQRVVAATEAAASLSAEAVDADSADQIAGADCVVWVGETTVDDLDALAAAPTPLVLFGDGDAPDPGAALSTGVDDFVHTASGEAVLARRVRRLLDAASEDGDDVSAVDGDAGDGGSTDRAVADGEGPLGAVSEDGLAEQGRDGRERAGRVLDRMDEGVIGLDDDLQITYANAEIERLLGSSAPELVGKDVFDVFPAAEGTAFEQEYRAAMDSQEGRTFETYVDEYDAWLEARVYPAADGLSVYVRDVTEQKRAEAELQRNERALRELQRLASNRDLTLDEKLDRAVAVGRQRLDLPLGFLTRIADDTQTIVAASGDHDSLEPGSSAPLSEAYCRKTIEGDGLLALQDAAEEGWDDDPAYERFDLACYLGGKLLVGGELYGTLCFGAGDGRDRSFSDAERTFIELLIEWVSYELERRERQRELERFETIVRSVDDGVYELDAEGRFTFVNPALAAMANREPADLLGEHVSVVFDDPGAVNALSSLLAGDAAERTVESELIRPGRAPLPCQDSMTVLAGEDGVRGVVGVVRDVTEQQAQLKMLSELVASSRSFMQARDREEVADLVARAVAEVLGFELNVVRLYDRETDRLEPAGTTDAVDERLATPTYDLGEGGPGRAFLDGETVAVADTTDLEDDRDRSVVRSALHLPMGVHGTISIGAEEPDAFSDVDRQAAELLTTSAAAAANRAKREQEVREARERADTLVDRINGLIEDTVEVLVQAATREELEAGVVDRLVATDPYAFAWVGQPDLAAETVEASAAAGDVPALAEAVDSLSLDSTAAREAGDPVALALDEERTVIRELADVPDDSVHAAARDAGLGSLIAVPLTYKDASYGVLCVYATDVEAFTEREQVVLDALGRAVANAINAVESGRILSTDRVIELEFTVQDAALLFGRLSAQADARLELTGSVYESDGDLRLYVTATGADADDLRALLADDDAVADVSVISTGDEVLFEAAVEGSLVESLADYGAVTQSVVAEDGVARYTIELPYETEAREVFELVADRYDGTDLVGYHEHERPVRTRQEFREAVTDRFTDRQETAVRTAYLGGFFEWPREVDGDDLSDSMDIARPTYHQHLRAAQRKVFEELFDPGSGR